MMRYITMPGGKKCSLATYIAGWKALRAMTKEQRERYHSDSWNWHSNDGETILRRIREGVHDRINQRAAGLRAI